jgi:hypothetical protein
VVNRKEKADLSALRPASPSATTCEDELPFDGKVPLFVADLSAALRPAQSATTFVYKLINYPENGNAPIDRFPFCYVLSKIIELHASKLLFSRLVCSSNNLIIDLISLIGIVKNDFTT